MRQVVASAARRVPHALITLVLVAIAVSMMVSVMPGDPAAIAAGDVSDPAYIATLRHELGLDQSTVGRFFDFVGGIFSGDLGTSVSLHRGVGVATLIWDSLGVTMSLLLLSLIVALLVAVPSGYLAAKYRGGWIDRMVAAGSVALLATPPFVLGVVGVRLFALDRTWLPALGYKPIGDGAWEWLRHLILPASALAAVSAAELTRQIRSAFVDTFEQDYIRTATAKGLRRRSVVWKHALKNAASPIAIVTSLQVPRIIGAAVVVERVFALPGFGQLAFHSVERRDLPVMQGVVLVGAAFVVFTNLLTDVALGYLQPKTRHDSH